MELTSAELVKRAFLRLVGTEEADPELTLRGEATNEIIYLYLTRGCRAAQRWMLKMSYGGWRQRSLALSFTGSDATHGGRYADLPSDFLRAYGSSRRSALVEADGTRWGREILPDEDHFEGDCYYIRGDELWLARKAAPPSTLYLDYHYLHPVWSASLATIDFPVEARALIPAEAANLAKDENWLPGGDDMRGKIVTALQLARDEARDIARPTKQPRRFKKPPRLGNRW